MIDEKDRDFEPAKADYEQKIIYIFRDGKTITDINKSYWARYRYDIMLKIKDRLNNGFRINGKNYDKDDIMSISIIYPE